MPRPPSSDRYLTPAVSIARAKEESSRAQPATEFEPLFEPPDYLTITWLAGGIRSYSEPHTKVSGLKGTFLVGEGFTFVVYRTRPTKNGEVWAIKQPRLSFAVHGDDASVLRQLYSLSLELRVLTDQRIRANKNIAKLRDVIWNPHADDSGRYWPQLLMEYAEFGTLSSFYDLGYHSSDVEEEVGWCFAIGDALKCLHQCGIIHGDIKPENVLIFRSDSCQDKLTITPKLADFGFAVIDGDNSSYIPGGTFPWTAPEISAPNLRPDDLYKCDIYSFGLLVWFVFGGGITPFLALDVCEFSLYSPEARKIIQLRKQEDELHSLAVRSLSAEKLVYKGAFKYTLSADPKVRDLSKCLECLRGSSQIEGAEEKGIQTKTGSEIGENRFSLREMRHLGFGIQKQILNSLEKVASLEGKYSVVRRSEAAMVVAKSYLDYFGGKTPTDSLKWLLLAAFLGNNQAKSSVYRITKAVGQYEQYKHEILRVLIRTAEEGFTISVGDLLAECPDEGQRVLRNLRLALGMPFQLSFDIPPNANHYHPQEMPLLSIDVEDGPLENEGGKNSNTIWDGVGENLLHQAARSGSVKIVNSALKLISGNASIDAKNNLGQTALLVAFMYGNYLAAITLLEAGASGLEADKMGDTPLHWLHLFQGNELRALATALFDQGADPNPETSFQAWDAHHQQLISAGTPLHRAAAWNAHEAVTVLLDHGANPLHPGKGHETGTPLWVACTYHNSKVVKTMLERIEKTQDTLSIIEDHKNKLWPLVSPVLDIGYYYSGGANFGRMVRHTTNYREATKETIQALLEHGSTLLLPTSGNPTVTVPAVSLAIQLRCIDIVESIIDLRPGMIKEPGPQQQQPLHFAVQTNREDIVRLVISKGADCEARGTDGINILGSYCNHHTAIAIPRMLLQEGLTFEIPPNGFQTPFFAAVKNEGLDLARFVLENTPLHMRHRMINSFCHIGTNFKFPEPGMNVLGYIILAPSIESAGYLKKLFKLIEEFGAQFDFIVDGHSDRSALQLLACFQRHQRLNPSIIGMAREILLHYNSQEQIDYAGSTDGKTALWWAVRTMNYDLVSSLLAVKANPRLSDRDGKTALALLQDQIAHVQATESHQNRGDQNILEEISSLFDIFAKTLGDQSQLDEAAQMEREMLEEEK
ncbi:uncharacterized protein BDR25DRAFT_340904 [Lindgomyces ingoldianus]|uniref:Uncharacterized protein n=1 Tax=Lindgomyces ingoldianus TaxID=673940 RepID=A0ACB6R5C5_9PLEO|nr:uncharacterized protein BDR25DRAFT_340904 [Lindgomyces ingoldianus]KAF2474444.1 hypothetical protein BDR25DRAFT_340904 [Lindgomyces ingoldianus]